MGADAVWPTGSGNLGGGGHGTAHSNQWGDLWRCCVRTCEAIDEQSGTAV